MVLRDRLNQSHMVLKTLLRSGPDAVPIKAYSDDITAFVQTVKKHAWAEITSTRALIQPILDNVPTVNDTAAVRDGKIAKLGNSLDAVERGIFGGAVSDKYNTSSSIYSGVNLPTANSGNNAGSTFNGITLPN